MVSLLDDPEKINELDSENMLGAVGKFPVNARKALLHAAGADLGGIDNEEYRTLLITGMGGSAVGGLLLRDWLRGTCKIPIIVSRSYHIPRWVGEDVLVFAVSYSGETEETLNQYKEALHKGCKVICFCSGGKLCADASLHNNPLLLLPENYVPRAALASQFYSIAGVAKRMNLIPEEKWAEVEESIKVVESATQSLRKETPVKENTAKILAEQISGLIPYVYGSTLFETVAYRYSTQFNENSKSPAAANFFPEAFHNGVMAAEGKKEIMENVCGVLIRDPREEEPLKSKINRFTDILRGNLGRVAEVEARGRGELARMMSAATIGDYASVYLGILYGKDPTSMESIRKLKK